MNDESVLRTDIHDGIGTITFNRPEKLNALTPSLMDALERTLDSWRRRPDLRCVIVTGEGNRAFSVGFDLLAAQVATRSDVLVEETEHNFEILMKLWDLPAPTIAAVGGYALGAGANIAWLCDIVIAGESASFGEPEVKHLALAPLLLLPWMSGNQKLANLLYLTGDRISAPEALQAGMVARVVPDDQLLTSAQQIAAAIARTPPFAVKLLKQSLRAAYDAMGFRVAQDAHRARDELALGAQGIPEKDHLNALLRDGRMGDFLAQRDQ